MGVCTSRERPIRVMNVDPVFLIHHPASRPLQKRESDMNLVPGEPVPQQNWFRTDESEYDRERFMVVVAPSTEDDKPGKIYLIDVDSHSPDFGNTLTTLMLNQPGDEFIYNNWTRCAALNSEISKTVRNYLVLPCFNTSRIYVIGIDDVLNMKIAKRLDLKDMELRDTSMPLSVQYHSGKRAFLFISTIADKNGTTKGSIIRLDRRLFTISPEATDSDSKPSFTNFGGTFALHPRQGFLISAEWGLPRHIQLGPEWNNNEKIYGHALNVWEIDTRFLRQRIELCDLDGQWPICIRFIHNPELIHGFVITVMGGAIYHLHKNSKNDRFTARKGFQFPIAHCSGWIREEVPAMPVDMLISMDDQFLYVACWLHGFVAQFNISDPFNITPTHKVFLGGVIHKDVGVRLIRISAINFMPMRRVINGQNYCGGPAKLQLSLDGRRLYVANSFLRSWDKQVYPELMTKGSMIIMIHVNVTGARTMELDSSFCLQFKNEEDLYLAREMRFLNGDSTSDAFA